MSQKNIAVIGGGLAGLTVAARLSKSGYRVTIFEKNFTTGGKAGEYRKDGFRFDTGPSLLTLKPVIDEFFSFMGESSNPITFERIDPVTRYFFASGRRFDASAEREARCAEAAKLWPEDARSFKNFTAYAKTLYDLAGDIFLKNPIHDWRSLLKWKYLPVLLQSFRLDTFRSMGRSHEAAFKSPELRQFFGRFATYSGSSPYRAPATLNLISHVELDLGAWFIHGGVKALATAILAVGEKNGVEFQFGSEVEEILHDKKKVTGIRVNGKSLLFDAVIAASDAVTVHLHLIRGFPGQAKTLSSLEPSLSGLVFLWGLRGKRTELLHHNVFFSEDYQREFQELFDEKKVPSDPTVYVAITSKSDPKDSPPDCENWFVMVNAPYLGKDGGFNENIGKIRGRIIHRLRGSGLEIENDILFQKVISPQDFQRRDGSHRGAIYGLSSHGMMQAFLRPANQSSLLKGLYFVGGAAHPGGGVPLVIESARIVSEFFRGELA